MDTFRISKLDSLIVPLLCLGTMKSMLYNFVPPLIHKPHMVSFRPSLHLLLSRASPVRRPSNKLSVSIAKTSSLDPSYLDRCVSLLLRTRTCLQSFFFVNQHDHRECEIIRICSCLRPSLVLSGSNSIFTNGHSDTPFSCGVAIDIIHQKMCLMPLILEDAFLQKSSASSRASWSTFSNPTKSSNKLWRSTALKKGT